MISRIAGGIIKRHFSRVNERLCRPIRTLSTDNGLTVRLKSGLRLGVQSHKT